MKVRILLTTLLLALLSTSAIYAHDGGKGSCCKDKCTSHRAYVDDCDFCNMFRGWGGWRHDCMYHHSDACCSKEMKKDEGTAKKCESKCEGECEHSWRSHRAYWRHQHYYHHDHSKDGEDRG